MSEDVRSALDTGEPEHEVKVWPDAAQIADLNHVRSDAVAVVPGFNSMVGLVFSGDSHHRAVAQARKASTFCKAALGDEQNDSVRHFADTGNVCELVVTVARRDGATLIMIGSERPELRDHLLELSAAQVVRHRQFLGSVVR